MTKINPNVGKSHAQEMPKEIVERSQLENSDVIQFSLRPGIRELGLRLKNWDESPKIGLADRKVDLRMGGGRRDAATSALTKTAILARGHSFKSPRNPACQIHVGRAKKA